MTQIRRRLGDYASSKFLNSATVSGQEGPAVITHVSEEEVKDDKREGGKRLAVLVQFDRWPDVGLDLNATNIRALQDMFGEDIAPDDLRGRRVYVGTHMTNFGRGILLSPCPDSVAVASSAARQRIANARSAVDERYQPAPLPTLELIHSHDPSMPCSPDGCDVARAKSLGHEVVETWPAPQSVGSFVPQHQPQGTTTVAPAALNGPVPNNSPAVAPTVGTGPQAQRVPSSQPPSGPASAGDVTPPGQYDPADPGPSDDDIPF